MVHSTILSTSLSCREAYTLERVRLGDGGIRCYSVINEGERVKGMVRCCSGTDCSMIIVVILSSADGLRYLVLVALPPWKTPPSGFRSA